MFVLFAFAIIVSAQFVNAGHKSGGDYGFDDGFYEQSRPEIIGESDRVKSCPRGFTNNGKQCIKVLKTEPAVRCPQGFIRSVDKEDICAKYFDKIYECPAEYMREKGMCQRTKQAEPLIQCPPGFGIMGDSRSCFRTVPLPKKVFCPPGTAQRHDVCLRTIGIPPRFVCPTGFLPAENGLCQIVEEYDCSPVTYSTGKESYDFYKHHKKLRLLGEKKKHSYTNSKEVPPTETEFVSSKTCTRIRTEGAVKLCPEHSLHKGNECLIEEEVPLIEKPGGFTEEVIPALFVCPDGHQQASSTGYFKCLMIEEAPLVGFCPLGTEEAHNGCARFRPLVLFCPPEYVMEGGVCLRTIVAPPLVEFEVTFQCVGKDCDQAVAFGGHKHHKK